MVRVASLTLENLPYLSLSTHFPELTFILDDLYAGFPITAPVTGFQLTN